MGWRAAPRHSSPHAGLPRALCPQQSSALSRSLGRMASDAVRVGWGAGLRAAASGMKMRGGSLRRFFTCDYRVNQHPNRGSHRVVNTVVFCLLQADRTFHVHFVTGGSHRWFEQTDTPQSQLWESLRLRARPASSPCGSVQMQGWSSCFQTSETGRCQT